MREIQVSDRSSTVNITHRIEAKYVKKAEVCTFCNWINSSRNNFSAFAARMTAIPDTVVLTLPSTGLKARSIILSFYKM